MSYFVIKSGSTFFWVVIFYIHLTCVSKFFFFFHLSFVGVENSYKNSNIGEFIESNNSKDIYTINNIICLD